jgi:branched-subunit amino acid transport protein
VGFLSGRDVTTATFPAWLHGLSVASLAAAFACAAVIAVDETRRRQHMWIMNLVWPLCALFGSVLWLAFYWCAGRGMTPRQMKEMDAKAGHMGGDTPMPVAVAKGASHCGAGCALGDIIAEWLAFAVPSVAVAFGWRSLFGEKMFAVWVLDYLVAFTLGVAFQYFTIAPMRHLSVGKGIVAALKADAASITAWQVGMYGFMAVAQILWFRPLYGAMAEVNQPEFWFAMQIAMLCGFSASYPVNWILVRAGLKEKMRPAAP